MDTLCWRPHACCASGPGAAGVLGSISSSRGEVETGVRAGSRVSARRGCSRSLRLTASSSLPAPVPDFGRFASGPDAPSQLQGSSLEDLLCSHAPVSSEDDASPGCVTSSQVPFKAFLSSPELRVPRGSDRKLSPLLSPLQDPLVEKTLLETRDVGRPKKVCFSESSLPSGDRTRRSYYLNGEEGEEQAGVGGWPLGRVVMAQLLHPASSSRRRVCPCSWGPGPCLYTSFDHLNK